MRPFFSALFVLTVGCAALDHVVPAPEALPETSDATLELVAVRGQPDGLLLRIEADVSEIQILELYRVEPEAEPELLQSLTISPALADAVAGGVELLDNSVAPGGAYSYQLLGINADRIVATSDVVDITWRPPGNAENVETSAPLPHVVEVTWTSEPTCGATIFRRDVLADGKFEIVAEVEPNHGGSWVDRDVGPAGVWSYRVALTRRAGEVPLHGPPSIEVYASTPPDGMPLP